MKMVRNILTILGPQQHKLTTGQIHIQFRPNANQLLTIHISRFIAWAFNVPTDKRHTLYCWQFRDRASKNNTLMQNFFQVRIRETCI
jgi:hypothetical protein